MLLGQINLHMKLFLREKASVFWSYAFPVFLILLFGTIFGGNDQQPFKMRVGVADLDQSFFSRILVDSALAQIPTFRVVEGDQDSLLDELRDGTGVMVVEIPPGFGEQLLDTGVNVRVHYNESNIRYNALAQGIMQVIEYHFAQRMSGLQPPMKFENVEVGNIAEDWDYIDYLLPGLIGISVMSTCLFSIGFVLTSYREKGNLKRLQVTPLPKWVFVTSIIIQRYLIILSQAVLLLVIAIVVFGAQINGSLWEGWAFLTLGMLAFISLGFLIGARIARAETGAGIANVIFFPMMFLSGTFFPVDNLPGFLQPLLKILPLKYLVEGLRKILVEDASILSLGLENAVLAGCTIVFFLISLKIFRWQ
ncbi:ABC transporter permease [Candidatus Zixiibacteriota bacterium]